MKIIQIPLGVFETNTYILHSEMTNESVIIDPAIPSSLIFDQIKERRLSFVVNTHGHFDHIGGNAALKTQTNCSIVIHEADAAMLENPDLNLSRAFGALVSPPADQQLKKSGNFVLKLDNFVFEWFSVPGHTDGEILLYDAEHGVMFSGDFIFADSYGRTDFPGGSADKMRDSLLWIRKFPNDIRVYPGHGESFYLGDWKNMFANFLAVPKTFL